MPLIVLPDSIVNSWVSSLGKISFATLYIKQTVFSCSLFPIVSQLICRLSRRVTVRFSGAVSDTGSKVENFLELAHMCLANATPDYGAKVVPVGGVSRYLVSVIGVNYMNAIVPLPDIAHAQRST